MCQQCSVTPTIDPGSCLRRVNRSTGIISPRVKTAHHTGQWRADTPEGSADWESKPTKNIIKYNPKYHLLSLEMTKSVALVVVRAPPKQQLASICAFPHHRPKGFPPGKVDMRSFKNNSNDTSPCCTHEGQGHLSTDQTS